MLFVAGLLAETWLLIEVGGVIGGLATIAICVATGFIGGSLARRQGMNALQRATQQMQQGALPTREMVDGVLILIAGVVLLTPGYLSDALGFLLLTPPVRALIRPGLLKWAKNKVKVAQGGQMGGGWVRYGDPQDWGAGPFGYGSRADGDSADIEGEVELLPPQQRPRPMSERRGPVKIIDP